jgi:hypothetical protein
LLFWEAVLVAGIVVDQTARRSRGTFATSGELVRFTTSAPLVRILLVGAWLFAGYHLFAR